MRPTDQEKIAIEKIDLLNRNEDLENKFMIYKSGRAGGERDRLGIWDQQILLLY